MGGITGCHESQVATLRAGEAVVWGRPHRRTDRAIGENS